MLSRSERSTREFYIPVHEWRLCANVWVNESESVCACVCASVYVCVCVCVQHMHATVLQRAWCILSLSISMDKRLRFWCVSSSLLLLSAGDLVIQNISTS